MTRAGRRQRRPATFGHRAAGAEWSELLADYDVAGRLWRFVFAWAALGPLAIGGALS
jgi:hypothetical protein